MHTHTKVVDTFDVNVKVNVNIELAALGRVHQLEKSTAL